jgi:predicted DsbA family dithiol-disulfide isomerase
MQTFDFGAPIRQSIDVQRLIMYVGMRCGSIAQYNLVNMLYYQNFERSIDIFDRTVLAQLACLPIQMASEPTTQHSLFADGKRAQAWLDSEDLRDEVLAQASMARKRGIRGSPFVVVDGKYGICGAQDEMLYLQVSS